jgi:hypothetical protein
MATIHEMATDRKLLSRGKLISDSFSELPRTSRYAFDNSSKPPSRQGLHSRSASFPQRNSKAPFFIRHNPHPKRVIHLKGLLDVPVCTVIDSNSHEDPERFLVRTPALPGEGARARGLRMPLNSTSFVTCREKAVPGIGLGKQYFVCVLFGDCRFSKHVLWSYIWSGINELCLRACLSCCHRNAFYAR